MASKSELINKVKNQFNLNIYETKVWLALLSKGMASAGEIAEASGVPRSRTYDVLESLEKNGFAVQKIGKPIKYLAVRPDLVVEKLKRGVAEQMNERIEKFTNIKDTPEYKELESMNSSQKEIIKKQDISGTIRGRINVNSQISDVLSLADKEAIICLTSTEFKKRIRLLEPIIKKLASSKIKLIVALSGADSEIKAISEKLGISVKKVNISASFYIADRTEILFMLNESEDSSEQLAVWFSSPFFVQSFSMLFDMAVKSKK